MASELYLPIHVYELALSDHVGTSQFHFVKNVPGWSGLYDRKYESVVDVEMIDVEVSTLDSVLSRTIGKCRFYKLDIEGGELNALKGSKEIIAEHSPLIVFENGFGNAAKVAGYSKKDWFAFFDSFNYRTLDLYGYKITPDRWPDHCQPFNTIAARQGSDDARFVETAWRDEVDLVISEVRNGTLRYDPIRLKGDKV
jgi:FkbM family methyltransferase